MPDRHFRRGDPVAYRVWRFNRITGAWSQIDREANVSGLPGDKYRWRPPRPRPEQTSRGRVPAGHVRVITPHDGGKRMTLPQSEVFPR